VTFRAKADFSDILKQAEAVGQQSGDLFSKAMSSSLGGKDFFKAQFAKFSAFQKKIDEDRKKFLADQASITKRQHILELANSGKLQEHREKAEIELDKLRTKFARAEAARDQKEIDSLKEQRKAHEDILAVVKEYSSDKDKFTKDLKQATKDFDDTIQSLKDATGKIKLLSGVGGAIASALDIGFEKAGDKLTDVAEKMGDIFTNGIDVTDLTKKLSVGLGRGLSQAGKSISATGGKGAQAMGALLGSVGMLVGALGALVGAFIGFDKKVKEFNKGVIQTHGALSLMRLGAGNLNDGLNILRNTVTNLSSNFGVSEDDAKTLFDALDKGGITLTSMTQGTSTASAASDRLSASLRDVYSVANVTGVSLSDYTDNLTNYVNDLAMSTQTVNDSFASIASMASQSAFGTRRFYSMVVQATQGQTSLNTRLEDTGDLLLRMSKIMGQKKATEAVGGAKLSDKSTQDLTKMVIQSRGGMRRVIEQEARATSGNLARQAYGRGQGVAAGGARSAVGRALTAAHLSTDIATALEQAGISGDSTALINTIKRMNPEAQADAITAMTNSTDRGVQDTGRRLQEVVTNIRGMTGGIGAQTEAMANFGPRGSIMAVMASTNGVLGNLMEQNGEISERNLMALENVSGYSREQLASMRSLLRNSNATWRTMTRIRSTTSNQTDEEAIASARTNGAIVRNGRIIQASVDSMGHLIEGAQLTSARDMIANENTALDATGEAARTAMDVAQDTMDATVSVADILENKVARLMQSLYEVVEGPIQSALSWIMDKMGVRGGGDALRRTRETTRAIDEQIARITDAKKMTASGIARQRGILSRADSTEEQKVAARVEIKRLQTEAEGRRDSVRIQALTEAREHVRSGNTNDTRAFRVFQQGAEADRTGGQAIEGANRAFSTRKEAEAFLRTLPNQDVSAGRITEEQLSPDAVVARVLARATGGTAAATTTPATTPGTAAPAATVPPPPPPPAHVEAATAPVAERLDDAQTQAQQQHERTRRETRQRDQRQNVFNEKLIKGKELGDGLAMSKLPDAIAEADAKMRLTEALFKSGKTAADVTRILSGQNLTAADSTPETAGLIGARTFRAAGVNDFISQDRGGRTIITPINRADQVMGMKPGGPVANAGSRGGGGNVNISINGGDERRVFDVVRRAIQQAGITPNRVPGG